LLSTLLFLYDRARATRAMTQLGSGIQGEPGRPRTHWLEKSCLNLTFTHLYSSIDYAPCILRRMGGLYNVAKEDQWLYLAHTSGVLLLLFYYFITARSVRLKKRSSFTKDVCCCCCCCCRGDWDIRTRLQIL